MKVHKRNFKYRKKVPVDPAKRRAVRRFNNLLVVIFFIFLVFLGYLV